VLIDGLDPFGGEQVVPSGRLREPLEALRRANIFVVTRCDSDARFNAIAERLREFKRNAPVFRCRLRTFGWRNSKGQPVQDLPGPRVAAFCGLGNPQSFWNTLTSLGLELVIRRTFRDHHRYGAGELKQLLRQAETESADCVVTTEKDWINLPAGSDSILRSAKLFWLEIGFELDCAAEFFSIVQSRLEMFDQDNVSGKFKTVDS
jgi:tetraacyldisaccharide 4'-kinase